MELANEIIGTEVFGLVEWKVIGKIMDIIADPVTGTIIAYKVFGKKVKKSRNIISTLEVIHIDKDNFIIESIKKLEPKDDLPKAYGIIKNRQHILGKKVKRENGNLIGSVVNMAISLKENKITRLYVSKKGLGYFLKPQLIYSFKSVIGIEKKYVIIA